MSFNPDFISFRFISLKLFFLIFCFSILPLVGCIEVSSIKTEKSTPNSLKKLNLFDIDPNNNATSVKRDANIILKFNTQLDPSTIKSNLENNTCSGTIQISSNNFKTCLKINNLHLFNNNKNLLLKPTRVYKANAIYKIRVTKNLKAKNGTSLKDDFITSSGFRTTWSHQLGTSGDDYGIEITVDSKENIYVTGLTSANKNNNEKDLFLTKFSMNGYQKWIIQAGFDRSVTKAVLKTNDNNKIVLGAYSNEKEKSALLISNYSFNGKKIFAKTIPLNGESRGNGLTIDKEGNIYVTSVTPFDILKIGGEGKKIWGNQLNPDIEINDLDVDKSNNLYITGIMKNSLDGKTSKGGSDIFLLKISHMGPKIWSRTFGSKNDESATSIAIKSDDSIAISGYITQSKSFNDIKIVNKDAFVAKYSKEGELKWTHIFKGKKSQACTVSKWTAEGSLLVGGYTEGSLEGQNYIGKEDSFLAKFNDVGDLIWIKQFGTEENERPLGIGVGNEGQIYVTGFSEGQIDGAQYNGGRDIFIVKYNKNGIKQ